MVRHFVIALLVLAANQTVWAQATSSTVEKRVQRMATPRGCDVMTKAEGLPSSTVRAVLQDKRGFMWLGTEDGLARYDGIGFYSYRTNENDPKTISSPSVNALALDSTGKIWVGTDKGANLYDPETDTFTRYPLGSDGKASVVAIARDPKGRMYFGLAEGGAGITRFDPATGTFAPFLGTDQINAIAADPSGDLWLGTFTGAVLRWNPDNNAAPQRIEPTPGATQSITSVLVSSTGNVWIGSDGGGLFSLDPKTNKLTAYHTSPDDPTTISDDHISAIFEDHNKVMWIGTTKGVNRMDATGKFLRFQHDDNDPLTIPDDAVLTLYQDAGGVMWLGARMKGVCKFDERRRQLGYYHTPGAYASAFWEDPDGTLWVGAYLGGLLKYDRTAQRLTVYTALGTRGQPDYIRLDANWLWKLHRDKRGTMWISIKGEGLVAFDTATETHKVYRPDENNEDSLPDDQIFDIAEDERGMIWLASSQSGLVRFDTSTDAFTSFPESTATGLTSNGIYKLYLDPKDPAILWIGTANGGLVRYNLVSGSGTSFRSDPKDPTTLSSDNVVSLYRDDAGIMWVGTYESGLNRLDPTTKKVERFTTTNSKLTNDRVFGILPDGEGKLWVSTSGGGLLHFDPKTKNFLGYNSSDGAQDEYAQMAYYRGPKSGELFFGGSIGFNAFFPKEVTDSSYVPPIVMTSFKIDGKEVKLNRPIWTLPTLDVSYADVFELQFAAMAFSAPAKNQYAYKLEGEDDKFTYTDRPVALYRKLNGGHKKLIVRAANEHGVWNEQGIALNINVKPPIWRTWPAFIAYLVVLAGIASLLFWIQRQRLRRVERESRLVMVEQDLALTGAVQTAFLPENNEIRTEAVQVFGFYRPADSCSGDWWWHERTADGRHLILVGDVTGHGPGPAMVTAAVATAFRVLVGAGLDDLTEALQLLNREVLRVGKGSYYMTMAALEMNEVTGEWTLHSAGAPPMLGLAHNGKHRVYFCPGSPLGTAEGFESGSVSGVLQPTDRLLLYTDGMPEIELSNGNTLGMRRFAQLYESTRPHDLRTAAAAMVGHADQIQRGQPQMDDWTFTMIEWGQRGEGRA